MSEALRYNKGKPELSYMFDFPRAVKSFAQVCTKGAEKYDKHNWKKGRKYTDTLNSLYRHLLAFQNGEDIDEETGCEHMAMVMWNAAALVEFTHTHPEMDDRDKDNDKEIQQIPNQKIDDPIWPTIAPRIARDFEKVTRPSVKETDGIPGNMWGVSWDGDYEDEDCA